MLLVVRPPPPPSKFETNPTKYLPFMFAEFEVLLVTLSTLGQSLRRRFQVRCMWRARRARVDMHPQLQPHQRLYTNGPKRVSQRLTSASSVIMRVGNCPWLSDETEVAFVASPPHY